MGAGLFRVSNPKTRVAFVVTGRSRSFVVVATNLLPTAAATVGVQGLQRGCSRFDPYLAHSCRVRRVRQSASLLGFVVAHCRRVRVFRGVLLPSRYQLNAAPGA